MKNILLLLLVLFSSVIYAQENQSTLTLKYSPEFEDDADIRGILAQHTDKDNRLGMVAWSYNYWVFNIYNESLTKIFTYKVDRGDNETTLDTFIYEDQIRIFTVYTGENRYRKIFCHVFDMKDRSYKKVLVFETELATEHSLFGDGMYKRITESEDKKYFALTYFLNKEGLNSSEVSLFNATDFSLIYTKHLFNHATNYLAPLDVAIDSNGLVYYLAKTVFVVKEENEKLKVTGQEIKLLKIKENNMEELMIYDGSLKIRDLHMVKSDRQLNIIGFYAEQYYKSIKGTCGFLVNLIDFSLIAQSNNALPDIVYMDIYGKKRYKRLMDIELEHYTVNQVIKDEEGNLYMIAEERTHTVVPGGLNINIPDYHFYERGNLIMISFNEKSELRWARGLQKIAATGTLPIYNAMVKGNELHIIMNIIKLHYGKNNTVFIVGKRKRMFLYDIVYNEEGNFKDFLIDDNKDLSYNPGLGSYYENTMSAINDDRKTKRFIIIK